MAEEWSLHHGEAMAWLCTLPSNHADAVISDTPYSSGGRTSAEKRKATTKKYTKGVRDYPEFEGDSRDQRSWEKWMTMWLAEALRVARSGAPVCVFSDWRQLGSTIDSVQMGGWVLRGVVAWDKTRAARNMLGRFSQQAEFVVWGSKGDMSMDRKCGGENNVLPGVFTHRVDPKDKHHVTGKPTGLMLDLVKICEPGGLILDPFAGSATTGIAALRLGYRFAGCELSDEYHAIAHARLSDPWAEFDYRALNPEQLSLTSLMSQAPQ